ncbi:uncharacterized protein LOC132060481 [Lycium ferocissimum]|uniref:uncharacterized protein LOC132060481 n=1 Tax=Lycium ferocissimum TaxID=112874 RepID=UPI0028164EAD|nr:uncharacterized protein LOC132060481 [Lycium ferocissimum]
MRYSAGVEEPGVRGDVKMYRDFTTLSLVDEDAFEVCLINPQRKDEYFPKVATDPWGGRERDETIKDAAQCETMEEAGVQGDVKLVQKPIADECARSKKTCKNGWVKEALEQLVSRLTSQSKRDQRGTMSRNPV